MMGLIPNHKVTDSLVPEKKFLKSFNIYRYMYGGHLRYPEEIFVLHLVSNALHVLRLTVKTVMEKEQQNG